LGVIDIRFGVMGAAALPARTGQGGADGHDKTPEDVRGDEADTGQATGAQAAEERQPAGAVFAGADVETENLAVPVGVDTPVATSKYMHVDHPAALADPG
jgi:hypothetical protein